MAGSVPNAPPAKRPAARRGKAATRGAKPRREAKARSPSLRRQSRIQVSRGQAVSEQTSEGPIELAIPEDDLILPFQAEQADVLGRLVKLGPDRRHHPVAPCLS